MCGNYNIYDGIIRVHPQYDEDLPPKLIEGQTYLIKEHLPEKSFELFYKMVMADVRGLCITRIYPEKIRKKYSLKEVDISWLTDSIEDDNVVNPLKVEKLEKLIVDYIGRNPESVVYLEGVEYLITRNNFEKILKVIYRLRDYFLNTRSMFIITIDPRIFDERQIALLEKGIEVY